MVQSFKVAKSLALSISSGNFGVKNKNMYLEMGENRA